MEGMFDASAYLEEEMKKRSPFVQ